MKNVCNNDVVKGLGRDKISYIKQFAEVVLIIITTWNQLNKHHAPITH